MNVDSTECVRKNKFLLFIIMFEMIFLSSFFVITYINIGPELDAGTAAAAVCW